MADPRVTQQFVEVIRGDTAVSTPNARVTQQFAEVIRGDTAVSATRVRVTQQFVEVIRSIDVAAIIIPQIVHHRKMQHIQ